jgi:hypothetical protein
LRKGRWGVYLDPREMKRHEAGENRIIRSFIVCTALHQILLGKSRRMKWAENAAHGRDKNAYNILVGKTEAKRPLEILRRR